MREACLILRNQLNDGTKALKSKEEVRDCMLVETASQSHIDPQKHIDRRGRFNFIFLEALRVEDCGLCASILGIFWQCDQLRQ